MFQPQCAVFSAESLTPSEGFHIKEKFKCNYFDF